jgi:hypothetical protein
MFRFVKPRGDRADRRGERPLPRVQDDEQQHNRRSPTAARRVPCCTAFGSHDFSFFKAHCAGSAGHFTP